MPDVAWTVVVPVKGTARSKSRLNASPELARAIALDTVSAALSASSVRRVMVVTTASAAPDFVALGAEFVHDSGDGLNVACLTAAVLAQPDSVAFLLGDVPSMLPDELSGALDLAATHPMAFVADAENDGTVLLTALNPADHIPRFGKHSRAAHLAAGYTELTLPSDSGLRRDVDTRDQLRAIPVSSLGTRTAAALEAINLNS